MVVCPVVVRKETKLHPAWLQWLPGVVGLVHRRKGYSLCSKIPGIRRTARPKTGKSRGVLEDLPEFEAAMVPGVVASRSNKDRSRAKCRVFGSTWEGYSIKKQTVPSGAGMSGA